ncbi:TonB-dependent receptor [bacterium]|nr:TonB-dependent receptor [bacterium]
MNQHQYAWIVRTWTVTLMLALLWGSAMTSAQIKTRTDISGTIRDAKSGETLPYANVMIKGTNIGTATNADGYFVLVDVPKGRYTLRVQYIGCVPKEVIVSNLDGKPAQLIIKMEPTLIMGQGITVEGQAQMMDATQEVSRISISPRQISSLPNIGEVDVFRTLQLLPGVSAVNDGSSGLYVRGGTPDQNLVLFDGMTIYHVDHFFGFFSAFNADALKDIQLMKGGFPAEYGGRISSVVNLVGKNGDSNRMQFSGGANLLSAHAAIQTPISDWGTFILTGRRSFADFIQSGLYKDIYEMVTGDEGMQAGGRVGQRGGRMGGVNSTEFMPSFYFYDINARLNITPTFRDQFTLSLYTGKDNLDNSRDYSDIGMGFSDTGESATLSTTDLTEWGNMGASGEWARQWTDRFQTDLLLAYSQYFSRADKDMRMEGFSRPGVDSTGALRGMAMATEEDNDVRDWSLKLNADWHATPRHHLQFGLGYSRFKSEYIASINDTVTLLNRYSEANQVIGFIQDRWKLDPLEITMGLRATWYQPTEKTYVEPRLSASLALSKSLSLKGAWGQYNQFVNQIANENFTQGSRDFWLLADDELKPTWAEHYILGLSYELRDWVFSTEAYYKNMDNLIEYTRRFRGRPGENSGDVFYIGDGTAKGIEFLAQKRRGSITGWLGYTLGRVDHTFEVFNEGNPFPADHDRTHELNLVAKYNKGPWSFGATLVYATGQAYTAPESQYSINTLNGDEYSYIHVSEKNAFRLPDYFRMDLSVSRHLHSSFWDAEIGISTFNTTNHRNVWYREYNLDTSPLTVTDVLMLGFTPTLFVQFSRK